MVNRILLSIFVIFMIALTLGSIAEACKPSGEDAPVCASNGQTYRNGGYFFCLEQWPEANSHVHIVHEGACE